MPLNQYTYEGGGRLRVNCRNGAILVAKPETVSLTPYQFDWAIRHIDASTWRPKSPVPLDAFVELLDEIPKRIPRA